MPNGTITLSPVANPTAGAAFTISGTLKVTPSVSYKDDGGAAHAVTVAAFSKAFTVNHPGLAAGSHTVVVSDAVTGASASVALTIDPAVVNSTPDNTFVTDTTSVIYDTRSPPHAWGLKDSGGTKGLQVTENGVVRAETNNVTILGRSTGPDIHQFGGGAWWAIDTSKSTVGDVWFQEADPRPGSPPPPPPPPPPSGVPAAAAAVGYNKLTHGPAVTLGKNWFQHWPGSSQNPDGSVRIFGDKTYHFNDHIGADEDDGSGNLHGVVFGGGAYFECVMSIENSIAGWCDPSSDAGCTGWPAWWANGANGVYNGLPARPGQEGIEFDAAEFLPASDRDYSAGIIYWHDNGQIYNNNDNGQDSNVELAASNSFADKHTYGWLWVPATATTKGYIKNFFDGVQVGQTYTWDKYSGPGGSSPWGVMDLQKQRLMIGTGMNNPVTVYSVSVWQKDDSQNLRSGVPLPA